MRRPSSPRQRRAGLGQRQRAVAAWAVLGAEQAVDAVGDPVQIEHRRVSQPGLVDEVQHRVGACAVAAPATSASTGRFRRAARGSRETRTVNAVSR